MEWYQWVAFFGGSALFGAILVDIYTRIKFTSKKIVERKKKENKEEIRSVVEEVIAPIKDEIMEIKGEISDIKTDDIKVLKAANRDSLRNQLLEVFRSCQAKKFKTTEDIRNFEYMFESYRALSGNSFMLDIARQFDQIETKVD